MIRRRFGRSARGQTGLSPEFDQRLRERLVIADSRRRRRATLLRWRWTGMVLVPLACAVCWAILPLTFGEGVRALIGSVGYGTMLLAVAEQLNRQYLGYLGLSAVPVLIDALLLVGVVSWLTWASRADDTIPGSASFEVPAP